MNYDEKLIESTKEAVEQIKKRDLKGDVYAVKSRAVSHSIEKAEVKDSSEYEEIGLGIRVIQDGKIGFGYCIPENAEKGVKRAIELTHFSEKTDITLPSNEDVSKVKVYDDDLKDLMSGRGIDLTQEMIDGCSSVKDDIKPTRGGLNIYAGTKMIANTNDLFLKERKTTISPGVTATLTKENTSLQAHEIAADTAFDLDLREIGKKAADKVDSMRKTSEELTGEHPVVISQYALTQLIGFGLIPALIGENVRKGKSVYKGKLGEKVASEELTIREDPTLDWGLGSGAFDDEGVISKNTPLVYEGVLENFLYDLKEASKSSSESTANGVRTGFKTPPETKLRNIVMRGEDKKLAELFPDQGIYVDGLLGAHTTNPVSGDFSVVTNPVWRMENGERKGRIDGLMISGNIPDLLEEIELADDHKKCFLKIGSSRLILDTPSARIEGLNLSSR